MSRFHHGKECRGGWNSALDPDEEFVDQYMSQTAIRRLGL